MITHTNHQVGNGLTKHAGSWSFDGNVPDVFVDHVSQSVPLYREGHTLVCGLSDDFVRDGDLAYELGVSTGELIGRLADRSSAKRRARWVGIDIEPAMIAKARSHCSGKSNVELLCDDVVNHEYQPCAFVVAYYTLQFIRQSQRIQIVARLYEQLHHGGALVMFEKVRGPDAQVQDYFVSLYHEFKVTNGFTIEEVYNKAQSLRGVLEPMSSDENVAMLRQAGFRTIVCVSKYICFEGLLAIK